MDQIRNTINKFANSFDKKDWEGLKSVLDEKIQCDYSSLRGRKEEITSESYVQKRMEALRELNLHHLISNHEIIVEGKKAQCTASAMIWRRQGEKYFNTHAIYFFRLRWVQDKWLISEIRQDVLWNEGDASIHSGSRG
ncbi:nuclear transport factor 2 family protein [Xanthovirga aplysinae]|uniref:nuclear transport factor 2 family protein n=1 Tax=Xanthovirga aplysinae TaxID=2529853 RepID=UPI0012BB5E5C|nr:nuclear transport factor 2 family protein [Xanthovirga aplysinae]MTI32133.1 hypothetical protein [Xanthovirga aplysinae]